MNAAARPAADVMRPTNVQSGPAIGPLGRRLAIHFGPEMIPRLQRLCRPDGRIFSSLWVLGHQC